MQLHFILINSNRLEVGNVVSTDTRSFQESLEKAPVLSKILALFAELQMRMHLQTCFKFETIDQYQY